MIAPGERYDVAFIAPTKPGSYTLVSDPYERGHETGERPAFEVLTLQVVDAPGFTGRTLPDLHGEAEALTSAAPDYAIEFDEHMEGDGPVFTINGKVFPDVPPVEVQLGATRVFEIKNLAEMDHPFHLHGFFFQVLARGSEVESPSRLVNKDTMIVKAKSSIRVVAKFDEPGTWVYHCHILEHAERGMMGTVIVK